MGQPVEGGASQTFAAEHFHPPFKGQVRGHDYVRAFVGDRGHVEQQFLAEFADRHMAQCVADQQVQFAAGPSYRPCLAGSDPTWLGHAAPDGR